ncbi:MAG: PEP-CTERM sorting domain-containing protein [Betaproteobacteria bacterium]
MTLRTAACALSIGAFGFATGMRVGTDGAIYRIAPVPEPQSWALLGLGLALLAFVGRRRT